MTSEAFAPLVLRVEPANDSRDAMVTFSTPDHGQATIVVSTAAIKGGFLPSLMRRAIAERERNNDALAPESP